MRKYQAYILVILAGVFWGCTGMCMRFMGTMGLSNGEIAFHMTFWGFITSCPLMLDCSYQIGKSRIRLRKGNLSIGMILILFVAGSISESLYSNCYSSSVNIVGVALAGVLLYMAPALAALQAKLFLKESLGKNKVLAIILNLLGAACAVTGGSLAGMNFDPKGILFGFIAALIYASVTVSNKYFMDIKHIDVNVLTFYLHIFGFMTTAVVTKCWTFDFALVFSPKALLLGFCVGGVCSLLPYYLYVIGLSKGMEASKAPVLSSNEVVVSVMIGAIVFGEGIGLVSVIGIALVLGSIALINLRK